MNKVEVYNSDYTKLNHAYIEIYQSYEKLIECRDADDEILTVLESILRVFNPALDKIKSEMTVKTRYKEEPQMAVSGADGGAAASSGGSHKNDGPRILKGNFTGE
ncbi:MAG: hypothetical protein K6B73_03675 [Treponema sp.]|nr:hypothetical protein [Treponema sp.]